LFTDASTWKLRVAEFAPGTALRAEGSSYYSAPAASVRAGTASSVRQGMLESSNVNPVTSVVELITAQREVETMRHVLTMINGELDKTAAQDLPRLS